MNVFAAEQLLFDVVAITGSSRLVSQTKSSSNADVTPT